MAAPAPPRNAGLVPGIVWAAALMLAPFAGSGIGGGIAAGSGTGTTAAPWLWGAGTVLLVIVFPWLLVRTLGRRGDLRQSIARAGVGPVVLGAGALCFMLLRLILWLDGPRELAAVVFAMIATCTLTLLPRPRRPDWPALSLGAGVVILPVLAAGPIPGPGGWAAAAVLCALSAAALALLMNTARRRLLASAAAGAVVGGGVFLLLRAAAG